MAEAAAHRAVAEVTTSLAPDRSTSCGSPGDDLSRVFHVLGKRWSGLLLAALMSGPGGFAELKRAVPGISERMLSDRLTELGGMGLVVREVEDGPPLRVSYRLTDAGHALRPAMVELTRWAEEHLPTGATSRCPEQFRATTDQAGGDGPAGA